MENYSEKIRTYLDNTFASIPQSEAAMRMKNDMYCSMLDKFNSLVQGGTSEVEAFGRVVGEFGSLSEIRTALGIDASSGEAEVIPVSPERKKAYSSFKIKQGIMIAIGVIFCIVSVLGYPAYEELLIEEAANALFGVLIAVGVFLFVFAGTIEAKYFDVIKPVKYAVPPTAERVAAYQKFLTVRALVIALAVFIFITSVFVIPLFEGWYMEAVFPAVMVSVGVAMLIIVSAIHGTYKDVKGSK